MDTTENTKISYLRISNGISIARIIAMLWIFSTNYFSHFFYLFYKVDYQYAIGEAKNFIEVISSRGWLIDRIYSVFAYAGWSGVIAFAFLTGFSLWFSILKSKNFKIDNYIIKRFNSIYVSYFFSIIIAFSIGVLLLNITPKHMDLSALIMGTAKFVPSIYEYNPPMWFITALFLLYLFFPIIPIIYNKFRFKGLLLLTLLSYAFYTYFELSRYHINSLLYPLMPFWVVLCIGVLTVHLFFKYSKKLINSKRINIILHSSIIFIGVYLLYKYLFIEPATNLEVPWSIKNYFSVGVIGALVFFSIGYLLPYKFHKVIRWLSRGTFAVFLYHYIILRLLIPLITRYIKSPSFATPHIFTSHISITLISIYFILLICLSVFQYFFDKTIIKYTTKLSSKEYKITE